MTAGLWSWKSKSAKKCVTTYLPNELALKMDGAQAGDLNTTVDVNAMRRRVGGRGVCDEVSTVRSDETDTSADLGGSSKYTNENFVD